MERRVARDNAGSETDLFTSRATLDEGVVPKDEVRESSEVVNVAPWKASKRGKQIKIDGKIPPSQGETEFGHKVLKGGTPEVLGGKKA